jgi:PIN domain nuclease of toxin-antitoxin system
MNLLLDTHSWIWLLHYPHRFSRNAHRAIANTENQVCLSPVSVWEASNLHSKKRIATRLDFSQWLKHALAALPITQVALTFEIAEQAAHLRLPQPDFGDIFLAATAIVQDLTLVTADEQLLAARWLKTLRAA